MREQHTSIRWLLSILACVAVGGRVRAQNAPLFAASSPSACVLPAGLSAEISQKYPGTRTVNLADLEDYKRTLFRKYHGAGACPGVARVNFYGDGRPTFAIVLIAGDNPKRKARLIVAHLVSEEWQTRVLDSTDGTPIVYRGPPGKYDDISGQKSIRVAKPVIVFEGLESWAVAYAWNDGDVARVQIVD